MPYKADPVTMQVIRFGLEAVADDMGYSLMRMGRTTIVKEIMDINCAVLDSQGGILAQTPQRIDISIFSRRNPIQHPINHHIPRIFAFAPKYVKKLIRREGSQFSRKPVEQRLG